MDKGNNGTHKSLIACKSVFIIGFMGTGKSTVAACLSKMTGIKAVEMDALISEKEGLSIPVIFEKHGEGYFRDLEANILKDIVKGEPTIVSCGGGVVMRRENASIMKQSGTVVLLTACPETIFERVKNDTGRPLLNNGMNINNIAGIMKDRDRGYNAAAHIILDTDGKTPSQICKELLTVCNIGVSD